MYRRALLYLLGIMFLLPVVSAIGAQPRIPAPTWIDMVGIGDKVIRNGLPATVYAFSTTRSPDDVFAYYRNLWQGRGPAENAVREVNVPPWRILSHVENRLLYTLQIRDDSRLGAAGYLAVTEPDNVRTVNKADVPALEGSRIGNVMRFKDNGRESRVCQLENRYTMEQNASFYEKYYTGRGWTAFSDAAGEEERVLRFNRREREVNIVLNTIGGMTRVVINTSQSE